MRFPRATRLGLGAPPYLRGVLGADLLGEPIVVTLDAGGLLENLAHAVGGDDDSAAGIGVGVVTRDDAHATDLHGDVGGEKHDGVTTPAGGLTPAPGGKPAAGELSEVAEPAVGQYAGHAVRAQRQKRTFVQLSLITGWAVDSDADGEPVEESADVGRGGGEGGFDGGAALAEVLLALVVDGDDSVWVDELA